jgi:hypothetical protein
LYLLNEAHPKGKSKAAFFRRFGFRPEESHVMAAALLRLARETEMTESTFAFGLKYVGIGSLNCPDGRQVSVRSVWMLRDGGPVSHSRLQELELAVLRQDLLVHGLIAGDIGTVVFVHADGKAYEVEFVTADGRTVAVETLAADQVEPVTGQRILHARKHAAV